MKAYRIHQYGGPDTVKLEDAPQPEPKPGQVLIKIHASAVNPVDWKVRDGDMAFMNYQFPVTLGCDFAGVVEQASGTFLAGDEVFGSFSPARNGAFAEYGVGLLDEVAKKPAALDFVHAAAIPVVAVTAWQALFEHGNLQGGQTVLIHGAAGSVGSVAVQLAKRQGARVIGTASTKNLDYLRSLGADEVIDYKTEKFEDRVKDVDLVFDTVGGETQDRSYRVIRKGGALVTVIAPPSQEKAAEHGVRASMVLLHGDSARLSELGQLVADGKITVRTDRTFPFSEALEALSYAESGKASGKVLLKIV